MRSLDDLFPGTIEEYNANHFNSSERHLDGYGYKIGNNKYVYIDVDDREDGFNVEVNEFVTGLAAKPSARIKNPRKRQLKRTVSATVASIDEYSTIADAVNAVAAKLRENYSARYTGTLEGPLEAAITTTLKYLGVQPPGEA